MAAVSRTERVSTPSMASPPRNSPRPGPHEMRPREGFKPTSPHSLAGIRIDPPPSLACAAGTSPAATAAAEPPLEPPVERLVSHGVRLRAEAPGAGGGGGAPPGGVLLAGEKKTPAAGLSAGDVVAGG